MAEFTLKPREEKTLRINIGEDSFLLPLQGTMTFEEAKAVSRPEGAYAYLKKHVPEEIFNALTIDEYTEIMKAWNEESAKAMGINLGEFAASRQQ